VGTIIVHLVLFLILWFAVFKTPLPPFPELGGGGGGGLGFEVNIGDQTGQNDANISFPQFDKSVEEINNPEVVDPKTSDDNFITDDASLDNPLNLKNNKNTKNAKKKVEEPQVNTQALYNKNNNKKSQGSGTGQGTGNGSGTGPGSGSGTGGGNGSGTGPGNGSGTGPGNGTGHNANFSLAGRSAKTLPAPDFNNVQGKVVVRIKVDPSGKVVDAEAISRGTTIANTKIWKKCEEFALRAKFSPKPDAPEVQQGTITYIIE
jgi:hypothetical protein